MDATAVCYIHCKKMPLRSSYAVFILILLLSCQEDAVAPIKEPNPLMGYLVSFLEEAEKRGVEIDTTGMTLELSGPLYWKDSQGQSKQVCGLGGLGPNLNPSVRISNVGGCWTLRNYFYRKELLFHEFGHAFLRRGHDNDNLPNGSKRSVMSEAIGSIFSQNETKLKYYIDELFDPSTPIPDWAK